MKTLNAWTFAKWGAVLLIYGITVAVGLDQIHERDKRLASMKADFFKYMASMESVTKTMDKSSKVDHLLMDQQKTLGEFEGLRKDLEIIRLKEQSESP